MKEVVMFKLVLVALSFSVINLSVNAYAQVDKGINKNKTGCSACDAAVNGNTQKTSEEASEVVVEPQADAASANGNQKKP